MRLEIATVTLAAWFGIAGTGMAQAGRKPADSAHRAAATRGTPPCCRIIRIDGVTRVVEARELSSRYSFEFKVGDSTRIEELRVGQRIWADFVKKRVSLRFGDPCCDLAPGGSAARHRSPS